jgi:ABC-2 type transport system ATP-binding protein
MSSDPTIIRVHDLTKRFDGFTAVDHITFEIQSGEVVGYLGPNGSGKTTTIRMLLGLLRPSEGQAQVMGYDAFTQSERVRERAGYMSQKFSLYHELTVWENLAFYGGVYGVKSARRLTEVLEMVGLMGLKRERVSSLSVGWRQRLALATAIVHAPRLLFLDEPTSGVDPTARRAFWDLIYEIVASGVTALVTTHYMDEAEYCGRIGIMRDGKLLAIDAPSALKENALPGQAWDVVAEPLLPALAALEKCPCVLRAGLAGDHLRAISTPGAQAGEIQKALRQEDLRIIKIEKVEPSLEDIFLSLAAR